MDIRYRCKKRMEQAPAYAKARFYQNRYEEKRLGQLLCFAGACLFSKPGSAGAGYPRRLFLDYEKRKAFAMASIQAELARYDVISFDVFDTLLLRTFRQPTDVFAWMEKRMGIPGFARMRTEAEQLARQRSMKSRGTAEITIEEIYQVLLQDLCLQDAGNLGLSIRTPEAWIQAEFAAERSCCRADPRMRALVKALLQQKKQVIAVSDMYLNGRQIRRLLLGCGYEGLHKVYASSDYRAGKSDGRLFPIVLREVGADRRMVHIGDNFYSDVYRQKALPVHTIHYL